MCTPRRRHRWATVAGSDESYKKIFRDVLVRFGASGIIPGGAKVRAAAATLAFLNEGFEGGCEELLSCWVDVKIRCCRSELGFEIGRESGLLGCGLESVRALSLHIGASASRRAYQFCRCSPTSLPPGSRQVLRRSERSNRTSEQ